MGAFLRLFLCVVISCFSFPRFPLRVCLLRLFLFIRFCFSSSGWGVLFLFLYILSLLFSSAGWLAGLHACIHVLTTSVLLSFLRFLPFCFLF